jgi:hypothetical protein
MNARRQIKKMPLEEIQAALRAESGTPLRPGDRVRRFLLWRQLDRIVRYINKQPNQRSHVGAAATVQRI